jgi:threonine/homoserine/homoserine lactone efflux protein
VASSLLTITALHWAALVTLGPNVIVMSQLSAAGSRNAALCAGLGISIVAALWATLAVLGISAVFSAHPKAPVLVQCFGGAYLCYLGLRFWRQGAIAAEPQAPRLSYWKAFRIGVLTNATNPKSALFFGSVFAAALPAEPSVLFQGAAISIVFLNALVCYTLLAYALAHRRVQELYAERQWILNRVTGLLVAGFGARLLFDAFLDAQEREGVVQRAT